jgi:hypothetical protein
MCQGGCHLDLFFMKHRVLCSDRRNLTLDQAYQTIFMNYFVIFELQITEFEEIKVNMTRITSLKIKEKHGQADE